MQYVKLNKGPKEVIFEIELLGTFNPDKISALWLFEKGILGEKEAKTVNEKYHISEKERSFSTKFLDIKIKDTSIKIGIIDLKTLDLLCDFVEGLIKELESSLHNEFSLNLKLHYTFSSQKELHLFSNGLIDQKWKNVWSESSVDWLILNTILPYENHNLSRDIVISPCPRQDLSYPIHINIHNKISLLSSKTHMFAVLTSEKILNTLNDSLATVNSVTDQFFIS